LGEVTNSDPLGHQSGCDCKAHQNADDQSTTVEETTLGGDHKSQSGEQQNSARGYEA
jgi:hypothetical protein